MISRPIFRSKPPIVVGMPVFFATDCFNPLIPNARFKENDNPFISFIFKYIALIKNAVKRLKTVQIICYQEVDKQYKEAPKLIPQQAKSR